MSMHEHCHRCGGEVTTGSDTPFCPHCGSPQLFLQEYDRPLPTPDASPSTGNAPPPHPQTVDWPSAVRCAALVAGIAAALSLLATRIPILSPLSSLTILSASILTLTLYQRRRPGAKIDVAIGARIGLVVGFALIVSLATSMAIAGLVARFVLHSMSAFDAQLTQQLHTQVEHAAAQNPTNPDLLRAFYTPEFRAGMMLLGVSMVAAFLLLLSTAGGALAGLFRVRRTAA